MQLVAKRRKLHESSPFDWLDPSDPVDAGTIWPAVIRSTRLPRVLYQLVRDFAFLRKRFARDCELGLTRRRYGPRPCPLDERPTDFSSNFREVTKFGDIHMFAFDYDHDPCGCGRFQLDDVYCACSRMYHLRVTLLPQLDFLIDGLYWFVLYEDISEHGTLSAKWEPNRCFLVERPSQAKINPWYRGSLRFRKPTFTETGTIQRETDAVGFATSRSSQGQFLYWLVLARRCAHKPEPDRSVSSEHERCEPVGSTWLDAYLPEWHETPHEREPKLLRFTWIELDSELSDDDPALESRSVHKL